MFRSGVLSLVLHCLLLFLFAKVSAIEEDDFNQNAYTINFERYEITWVDNVNIGPSKSAIYKYNRTLAAAKLTYCFYVPVEKMRLQYRVFKHLNMEFKFIGVSSYADACKALKNNYFGALIFKTSGNFTDCPFKPGYYYMDPYIMDSRKFPPLLPDGRYKIEINAVLNDMKEPSLKSELVISISYPLRKASKGRPKN